MVAGTPLSTGRVLKPGNSEAREARGCLRDLSQQGPLTSGPKEKKKKG